MRILGIESSSLVASVAIVTDSVLTAEYTTNFKKTHSQTLLPMLDEMLRLLDIEIKSVDAIAVSGGPGSFTGLRIGSATAKGLGLALDKPLIHVPTLDAMAYNLWGCDGLVCPLMDARRAQVYTGIYRVKDSLEMVSPAGAMAIEDLILQLNECGEKVVFLGDGVSAYADRLASGLAVCHSFAPAHSSRQRAASVASLGVLYFQRGETQSARDHLPQYFRKPQAEREREQQEREQQEREQQEQEHGEWKSV